MDLTLIQDKDFEDKLNIQTKIIKEITAVDDFSIRKKAENKKTKFILIKESTKKDYMKFRNSCLNQIICKILAKNNIILIFSFSQLLNSKNKPILLGRMQQNVKLCKKYKVKMRIASLAENKWELRSEDSLKSFGKIIGMKPHEVEKALN